MSAVHHAHAATRSELVDGSDGVDGFVQCPPSVEVLLDSWQQILFSSALRGSGYPFVGKSFVRCHALCWIDGETALDEGARWKGNTAPVFKRREGVIGDEDGLHLFQIRVAVEWGVAAEQEVGYDADCPHIAAVIQSAMDAMRCDAMRHDTKLTQAFRVRSS